MQTILSKWLHMQGGTNSEKGVEFNSATPGEVFDFLDKELGRCNPEISSRC